MVQWIQKPDGKGFIGLDEAGHIIAERDTIPATYFQTEDMKSDHKCRTLGQFGPHINEIDGIRRQVSVGRLLEVLAGLESETHCVHIEFGDDKKVLFFNNEPLGDCFTWTAIFQIIYGGPLPQTNVLATEQRLRGVANGLPWDDSFPKVLDTRPMAERFPPQRIRLHPEDRLFIYQEMEKVFDSGMYAYGKWVHTFEQTWAGIIGTRHAVATSSGTAALEAVIRGLRLRGKRVALPTVPYAATAQAILNAGGFVHLTDCDPKTGQLDPAKLPKTEDAVDAVCIVHLGGNIDPRLGEVIDYCKTRNVPLIEDAAHAHGATSEFGKAGAIGHAAIFSHYSTKIVGSGGEMGSVTCNDPELEKFVRRWRHHGRDNDPEDPAKYAHAIIGTNACPSEFQALYAFTQANRLRESLQARRKAAEIYAEKFHIIGSLTDSAFYKILTLDAIEAPFRLPGKTYDTPLHREPMFGFTGMRFPGSEAWAAGHSTLPVYNDLTEEEARAICQVINLKT